MLGVDAVLGVSLPPVCVQHPPGDLVGVSHASPEPTMAEGVQASRGHLHPPLVVEMFTEGRVHVGARFPGGPLLLQGGSNVQSQAAPSRIHHPGAGGQTPAAPAPTWGWELHLGLRPHLHRATQRGGSGREGPGPRRKAGPYGPADPADPRPRRREGTWAEVPPAVDVQRRVWAAPSGGQEREGNGSVEGALPSISSSLANISRASGSSTCTWPMRVWLQCLWCRSRMSGR